MREAVGALVEGEPVITVLTSQPVVASEVERLLTVQPMASYTVEALDLCRAPAAGAPPRSPPPADWSAP